MVNGYKALYARPQTFFEQVDELEPGSILVVDAEGAERSARYWRFPAIEADERLSYDDFRRTGTPGTTALGED